MNALLVILTLIFVAVLIAINIYILKVYEHTDDKGFFNALYCKILIIMGSTLFQAQALLVPLDVANESAGFAPGGLDMKSFWYFLYIVLIVFVCFLLPFALFFYETDSDQGICKRFLKSFIYTFLANISVMLLLFISYNFLKYADLPVHAITSTSVGSLTADLNNWTALELATDVTFQMQTSFAVYVIAITSFFGWILLTIFAGVGLIALPIDTINQFRFRPKARRSKEMEMNKNNLAKAIKSLLKNGEEIKEKDEEQKANQEGGFLQRWKGQRTVTGKMTQFKAKYFAIQEQFQIFNLQLKFSTTNPIIPILKLILGIIFAITSLLWILQMYQIILGNVAKSVLNRPLLPFLNQMLINLSQSNASFLATGIFFYLCIYIIWCVQKGTVRFGMRIPGCCRFHPMKQGETWMNSFLFNIILMLISSVGVIQLCISSFPTYTRNTDIYTMICLQLNYMKFYSVFYQKSIFPIALVICSGLALIYLLVTCNKKPPYMQEIDRIRRNQEEDFST